jgi:hypothetical protein
MTQSVSPTQYPTFVNMAFDPSADQVPDAP